MGGGDPYPGLEEFWRARADHLLAGAILLAGDRSGGEDLLQAALERVIRHWSRIHEDPEGYLRRCMYHLVVDGWRRRRRRPEVLTAAEPPSVPDATGSAIDRHVLLQALARLPRHQRSVLVLRHFEQLTEAETAAVLGCSVGAVKSSTSRGLAKLRNLLSDPEADALIVKGVTR